jgi:hypothetical protein
LWTSKQKDPDVTFMRINDPDETAHAQGIGSDLTRRALSLVDAVSAASKTPARQRPPRSYEHPGDL